MLSNKMHDLELAEEEEKLRDGVFNLNTRRFGKVAEYMIANLFHYSLVTGKTNYDLTNSDEARIEVKFSRAEYTEEEMSPTNCRDICMDNANPMSRRISFSDHVQMNPFDCNIQQIKAYEFDQIYYGIFFENQIAVFSMSSQDMKNIMTAQFFISDKKSPKPKVEKTMVIASSNTKSTKIVSDSISSVQKKFNDILKTDNKYADKAKEYLHSGDLIKPWHDIAIEIKNNGWLPSKQSDQLRTICTAYLDFCKREFSKTGRFPNVSPFQHRGNSKAEGQMHLNSDNIQWHIDESGFFLGWLSYKDLFNLLEPKF